MHLLLALRRLFLLEKLFQQLPVFPLHVHRLLAPLPANVKKITAKTKKNRRHRRDTGTAQQTAVVVVHARRVGRFQTATANTSRVIETDS